MDAQILKDMLVPGAPRMRHHSLIELSSGMRTCHIILVTKGLTGRSCIHNFIYCAYTLCVAILNSKPGVPQRKRGSPQNHCLCKASVMLFIPRIGAVLQNGGLHLYSGLSRTTCTYMRRLVLSCIILNIYHSGNASDWT